MIARPSIAALPGAPGTPTHLPELPGDADGVAAFTRVLVRLGEAAALGGDVSVTDEIDAQLRTEDDATAPDDGWAALWFPNAGSAPDAQVPASRALSPAPAATTSTGDPDSTLASGATLAPQASSTLQGNAAQIREGATLNGAATASDAPAGPVIVAPEIVTAEVAAIVESVASMGDDIAAASAPDLAAGQTPAGTQTGPPNLLRDAPPPLQTLDPRLPQAPARLAESIVWHLDQGVHEVSIDLDPQELGQIEIRLKLDGEHVDLRFDTADTAVRDVVQTSLPQLAAMLSARGLQLDQAQVFSQARAFTPGLPGQVANSESGGSKPRPAMGLRLGRRGLIDDYV